MSIQSVLHFGTFKPYSQTLDLAGKAWRDKHSPIRKLQSFVNIDPVYFKSFRSTTPCTILFGNMAFIYF